MNNFCIICVFFFVTQFYRFALDSDGLIFVHCVWN